MLCLLLFYVLVAHYLSFTKVLFLFPISAFLRVFLLFPAWFFAFFRLFPFWFSRFFWLFRAPFWFFRCRFLWAPFRFLRCRIFWAPFWLLWCRLFWSFRRLLWGAGFRGGWVFFRWFKRCAWLWFWKEKESMSEIACYASDPMNFWYCFWFNV